MTFLFKLLHDWNRTNIKLQKQSDKEYHNKNLDTKDKMAVFVQSVSEDVDLSILLVF